MRVELDPLDEDELYRVLVEPPDAAVREYKALLGMDGIELDFTEGALRTVARFARERQTGARALRGFIEELCHEIMFEAPERRGETSSSTRPPRAATSNASDRASPPATTDPATDDQADR